MVADKKPYTTIWNIFFHLYLNEDSYSVLIEQCRKLVELSESVQTLGASSYGKFIKMSTEYTLTELRRHWMLYIDMKDLPRKRLDSIRDTFVNQSKATSERHPMNFTSTRSAGPLWMKMIEVAAVHFSNYCKTGVTFSDPKQIAAATLLNPTFVYSLGGERCSIHYGTDVLNLFHLGDLFGNAKGSVSVTDAVNAAQTEFSNWCSAFHASISPTNSAIPVVRIFLGEATAVSRALRAFETTTTLKLGVTVMQWKAQPIILDKNHYVSGGAPCTFNVIDTSNLDDHIGLLNVLIATVPLLSKSSSCSVLYTESLLFCSPKATTDFAKRLHADITTMALLLGVCPVDYLSGFTTRSNAHELLMYNALKKEMAQFHQVTAWKLPTSGDTVAVRAGLGRQCSVFEPHQLGTLLYDVYYQLFAQEDLTQFSKLNRGNMEKAISTSNLVHYIRESFVLLVNLVKGRLDTSEEQWHEVMQRFFDLKHTDKSLEMDAFHFHDLCAQFHRHGVYTMPIYRATLPKIGRFSSWNTILPLVRVILIIPRQKLAILEKAGEKASTPLLQCDVRGVVSHNMFTAVDVAFGKVIATGTKANPSVIFEEDPKGWDGTSSLVASFTMPAGLLASTERPEDLRICISARCTPATVLVFNELGLKEPTLFSAMLLDESHVLVLPEQPLPSENPQVLSATLPGLLSQIGTSSTPLVKLDEDCELVESLTCKISVEDEEAKRLFSSGATPKVVQVSPCIMKITIGLRSQEIMYPFPVIGSRYKLRLARKSLYIEVCTFSFLPFSCRNE
jgi:hypothetical protein